MAKEVFYLNPPARCQVCEREFERRLGEPMYDAKLMGGAWAVLDEACFQTYTSGRLGVGLGQKYEYTLNKRWKKVEG